MKITKKHVIKFLTTCNWNAIDLLVEIANDDFIHSDLNDDFVPPTHKRGNLADDILSVISEDKEVA